MGPIRVLWSIERRLAAANAMQTTIGAITGSLHTCYISAGVFNAPQRLHFGTQISGLESCKLRGSSQAVQSSGEGLGRGSLLHSGIGLR